MTTPIEAMDKLDQLAIELDQRSRELAQVERDLEPVEAQHEAFCAAHEIGLWKAHEDGGLKKWPSEGLRERMAHQDMPPELWGRWLALVASRKRLERRIGALKVSVDAQRSILSALRTEMEATASGRR